MNLLAKMANSEVQKSKMGKKECIPL
jgi:hypothetical protein